MAFDLNKNDGSDQGASGKTSGFSKSASSKFDLSKNEAENVVVNVNSSKSKTWIISLVGVLIIGGGIWYYSSGKKADNIADSSLTAIKSSSDSVASVTLAKAQSDEVTAAQSETALNNKIPTTFAQGSSRLIRVDQSLIRQIRTYLTKNPDAAVHVNGYASSDGSLAINQTISQARADAFKEYLVSKNVDGSKVVASGKGIENPIASNDTNTGRKKNRRVEITFP